MKVGNNKCKIINNINDSFYYKLEVVITVNIHNVLSNRYFMAFYHFDEAIKYVILGIIWCE